MKKLLTLGQAIKTLRQNKISNSYFLYGNDIFMQDFFIKEFRKTKNTAQPYLYYLGYDKQESIFNELSNLSLFDSNKIIIIKNINRFSIKAKKDLLEYLSKTETKNYLILVKNNFDSRNKFIDSIFKNTTAIDVRTPFENKMVEWIKYFSKLENISINNYHIKNYIDAYGSNIANVMNYVRIDFLSKNSNAINSNRTYHLWNFQDSIANKTLNQSIDIFNSLLINGNSINLILIYLFNLYYYIYFFSYYKDSNFSHNFLVNKIIQSKVKIYLKKYSQNEIENIILEINKIDFLSKNTRTNINNRILCLVNNICNGYYGR